MVTANSRNLKKLAAAGSTHVNINSPLQAEEFEAGLAGSGIIQFHDTASFTNLKIEIAGSGDFVGHKAVQYVLSIVTWMSLSARLPVVET